ncbi:MAG TPA: c-type cytochrome domain-containing protein [Pirellulales bacterium]|jgi:WD40 repeat protein|nr:c-type cytochrome domain-containing protein [Pirellulales bacterium]
MATADDAKPQAPAQKPASTVSYFRDVRPIFQNNCLGCHQPAKAMGEFVMTSFEGLLKGGESEHAAVVVGKPDESNLLAQITPHDGKAEMPKDKPPLSEPEIKKIRDWIAAGATDDTPLSVRGVIDQEHPPQYEAAPVLTALDFSPDDSLLAISGYHETLLYRGDGSELVARLVGQSERVESLAFSPDGTSLAVTGGSPGRLGEVQVWDVASRKLRYSLPVTYDTVYGVSWSADGKKIAFGCADNTLRAIDATNGKQLLYQGAHSDWVLGTVFSKEGTYVISVSRDRSMKLVEVATQRFVDNITSITPGALKGGLAAVDRHPLKDELLIGGADGAPKIYQMLRTKARVIGDDFNLIKAYEAAPGRIYSARFNSDGSRFVVGSSLDGTGEVRIYETDSGKLLHKLEGQHGAVYAVTFSTSGKVVASAGFDGLVRLNDAETGKLIKEFSPAPLKAGQVADKVASGIAP